MNPRSLPGSKANDRQPVDVAIPLRLGRFKRLAGRQDPGINNGRELPLHADGVPHFVLNPGDGIVLVRQ